MDLPRLVARGDGRSCSKKPKGGNSGRATARGHPFSHSTGQDRYGAHAQASASGRGWSTAGERTKGWAGKHAHRPQFIQILEVSSACARPTDELKRRRYDTGCKSAENGQSMRNARAHAHPPQSSAASGHVWLQGDLLAVCTRPCHVWRDLHPGRGILARALSESQVYLPHQAQPLTHSGVGLLVSRQQVGQPRRQIGAL
mmetsp:Transcript_17927/g.45857  ORF Transcript_17927/g.45857 Transcript_17927/m.45857 type:complete len:200 (-) Transcript_17927:503-1102(-)